VDSLFPGVLPNEPEGTGSGCSIWEPKPAWQHDAGCAGRTVADISAVADNVAIFDSSPEVGDWGVVASTSIGSYPYSHQTSFHDVTDGSNFTPDAICGYLCTAEPGYDGSTGLGTPNGLGGF
jgi:hypothetical protein